ncbi:MAG: hypothetical protein V4719_00735 [Planctomycetota bacterium]
MPKWVCPSCSATMNVKQSLIGQVKPCAGCGAESEITDASALANILAEDAATELEIPKPAILTGRDRLIRDIHEGLPPLLSGYRSLGLIVAIIGSLGAMIAGSVNPVAFLAVPGFWIAFSLLYIVIEFFADAYRSRRLLEEIFRNQGAAQ